MSVILLVLGILLAAAGVAVIGFAIPINTLSIGGTLILAGAFGLVGGLLLIGLSAVVAALRRVEVALRPSQPARPAARTEPVASGAEAVAREIPPTVAREPQLTTEVSATAIERLRTNIARPDSKPVPEAEEVPLSPNGQHAAPAPQVEPPTEPAPRPAGSAAVETLSEPRLDFLFRPRQARPAQQPEFDALWPKRGAREPQPIDPRVEVPRAPAVNGASAPDVRAAPPYAPQPEPAPEARTVAILKSGVVDGMAYTLYADGSIEAQLPQGTVRFGSIAELRAHIENSSHA